MERGLFRESIFPSELEKATVENPEEPAAVPGHDGIEDTEITAEELYRLGFSSAVVDRVVILTRKDSEGYQDYIERCGRDPVAREVKLADLDDYINSQHEGLLSDEMIIRYERAWHYLMGRKYAPHDRPRR